MRGTVLYKLLALCILVSLLAAGCSPEWKQKFTRKKKGVSGPQPGSDGDGPEQCLLGLANEDPPLDRQDLGIVIGRPGRCSPEQERHGGQEERGGTPAACLTVWHGPSCTARSGPRYMIPTAATRRPCT